MDAAACLNEVGELGEKASGNVRTGLLLSHVGSPGRLAWRSDVILPIFFFSTKPFRALCGTLAVKWVGLGVKTLVRRPPKSSE